MRRHTMPVKDLDFDSYQLYLQDQHRDEGEHDLNYIRRMPGKRKLPKALVDVAGVQKGNLKVLQRLMHEKHDADGEAPLTAPSPQDNTPGTGGSGVNFKLSLKGAIKQVGSNKIKESETSSEEEDKDFAFLKIKKQGISDSESDSDFEEVRMLILDNSHRGDCCLLSPDSITRASWDLLLMFILIYQSITIPVRVAFDLDQSKAMFWLEIVIDILFMVDIVLNFNTGFYSKEFRIMKRRDICIDYLRFWFWIDLVSSVPYTWIFAWAYGIDLQQVEENQISGDGSKGQSVNPALAAAPKLLKLLKIAKIMKMLKLLRVAKLKKILQKFDEFVVSDSMEYFVSFLRMTIEIIVIAHYMCCLFYFVGMEEHRAGKAGWIVAEDLLDKPFRLQYITSMYWAFTTMSSVGFGDVMPITDSEIMLTVWLMIISCGYFAYTINSIGNMVQRYNKFSQDFRERNQYINKFLKRKQMPQELRNKVRRYMDYLMEQKCNIKVEESDVYAMLNKRMNEKLRMFLRGRAMSNTTLFKAFGFEFMTELQNKMAPAIFVIDDYLFHERDRSNSLFFISEGKVSMMHKASYSFITSLKDDSFLGEIGVLTGRQRTLSAKVQDYTHVSIINKTDLFWIAELFTKAFKALKKVQYDLKQGRYRSVGTSCYFCGSRDHLALDCKKFKDEHKGNIIKELNKKLRKNKARFTEDGKDLDEHYSFVYVNENHEKPIYQSEESDDAIEIKEKLFYRITTYKHRSCNGRLISLVSEFPHEVWAVLQKKTEQEKLLIFSDQTEENEYLRDFNDEIQERIYRKNSYMKSFKPKEQDILAKITKFFEDAGKANKFTFKDLSKLKQTNQEANSAELSSLELSEKTSMKKHLTAPLSPLAEEEESDSPRKQKELIGEKDSAHESASQGEGLKELKSSNSASVKSEGSDNKPDDGPSAESLAVLNTAMEQPLNVLNEEESFVENQVFKLRQLFEKPALENPESKPGQTITSDIKNSEESKLAIVEQDPEEKKQEPLGDGNGPEAFLPPPVVDSTESGLIPVKTKNLTNSSTHKFEIFPVNPKLVNSEPIGAMLPRGSDQPEITQHQIVPDSLSSFQNVVIQRETSSSEVAQQEVPPLPETQSYLRQQTNRSSLRLHIRQSTPISNVLRQISAQQGDFSPEQANAPHLLQEDTNIVEQDSPGLRHNPLENEPIVEIIAENKIKSQRKRKQPRRKVENEQLTQAKTIYRDISSPEIGERRRPMSCTRTANRTTQKFVKQIKRQSPQKVMTQLKAVKSEKKLAKVKARPVTTDKVYRNNRIRGMQPEVHAFTTTAPKPDAKAEKASNMEDLFANVAMIEQVRSPEKTTNRPQSQSSSRIMRATDQLNAKNPYLMQNSQWEEEERKSRGKQKYWQDFKPKRMKSQGSKRPHRRQAFVDQATRHQIENMVDSPAQQPQDRGLQRVISIDSLQSRPINGQGYLARIKKVLGSRASSLPSFQIASSERGKEMNSLLSNNQQ